VDHAQKSYQGILKSTALLGSARLMTMVIGMARVKVLAVLIGPIGIGLIGTYEVLVTMAF
jgi:PST family polysaccharide transporter